MKADSGPAASSARRSPLAALAPRRVARLGLAALLAALASHPEGLAAAEPYLLGLPPATRFTTSDGGAVVVSTEQDLPTTTACVADTRARDPGEGAALELARHGGMLDLERVGDVNVWCASAPRSELSLVLRLASERAHAEPDEGAAEASVAPHDARSSSAERVLRIAMEGSRRLAVDGAPSWAIAVVGPQPASEVASAAESPLSPLHETAVSRAPSWTFSQTTERVVVVDGDLTAPAVRYGWVVPSRPPLERAALDVALELLGGGPSSRLSRLVAERALARHAVAWGLPLGGSDLVGVWLELTTRVPIDRARRFVDAALHAIAVAPPGPRELARARAKLTVAALKRWEHPETRARDLAWHELRDGDASLFLDEIRAIEHVTRNTVQRVAHATFLDSRRTTVEVYPPRWPTEDPKLARDILYTVIKGDTLEALASRFHVDAATLARVNDVDPHYALVPGQPMWVPARP